MAVDEVVIELGRLGKWLQAVGIIVILWIIVQAVTLFYNRKRRKLLEKINERLERVEKKLDRIDRKR